MVVKEDTTMSSVRTAALLFKAADNYWPAENLVDPVSNRDIFTLLENPPPHIVGMYVGDGRNWVLIAWPHGLFYDILCPHHNHILGTAGLGKSWRYIRSPSAGNVGWVLDTSDGGH
jgi:hypothetical protein